MYLSTVIKDKRTFFRESFNQNLTKNTILKENGKREVVEAFLIPDLSSLLILYQVFLRVEKRGKNSSRITLF
jgi:hypothetical protein